MNEPNSPIETAPCPFCAKPVDITADRCPSCRRHFTESRMPWLLIVGLIIGVPILLAVSAIVLLLAICAMG